MYICIYVRIHTYIYIYSTCHDITYHNIVYYDVVYYTIQL